MSQHPDVLIAGGGVIGLTTAYFLAREGVAVTVVDKGDFGREASWAGAGILPPGNPARARTPFDQLRARSAAFFPELSKELRDTTGIDNGYLVCGGLDFPEGSDDRADMQPWQHEGIRFEKLTGKEIRRLVPAAAESLDAAYWLPDMAQLRNPRHLKALVARGQQLGVQFHPGCLIHGWQHQGGRVHAVKTSAGSLAAGRFLVAAGAWTGALLEPLGCTLNTRPVRGQIALLNARGAALKPILERGKRYLVPRPDGRVLVGSTEEDAGFDKSTTAAAIAGLLELAFTLVPALAQAHLERSWAGLRPGSPDGLPFLGAVPGFDNLFVAGGHQRAGIQLSPASALATKELLLGQKASVPLEDFRLERAPSLSHRPAFRS